MTKFTSLQAIAAAVLACGLAAAPAQAAANRTFVSGTGTDGGTCIRTAPCRTFAFAFSMTAVGGEIDVLDPAGYGSVTIIHAISIVNDGVGTAGITAGSGNAITINAGTSDSVHLRGLTLTGLGTGTNGIQFISGGNLAIENCVIWNFTSAGLVIAPSTSSTFSVSNTIASNNSGVIGILVAPTGPAVVSGVLSNVTANNNGTGINVAGSGPALNVTIADSVASNNSIIGVGASSPATAVLLRHVVASNNTTGLGASGSTIRVAQSVVTGNVTGVFATGGTIDTYGDNNINGNTTDIMGALTPITTQ
ncbi:MAG: right-handed parallel beta-helix repeat-containing protein [Methylocella sp.]